MWLLRMDKGLRSRNIVQNKYYRVEIKVGKLPEVTKGYEVYTLVSRKGDDVDEYNNTNNNNMVTNQG